jgi:3-hydroxybutyryl-CoA dehydrogenase
MVKQTLFRSLILKNPETTVLATNTSSISITKLASFHTNPEQVIGMHFMNPVPVMKLVEVIKGCQTSPTTLLRTEQLIQQMGKVQSVSEDVPGFIANRILMPYINEAVFTLYEGIASKEAIDQTMLLGTNVPMGPLALADFIGLDTCLSIMQVLHRELGDSKYRPCPLLVRYVNAGWFGRKSGRGFYEYTEAK